MRASSSSSTLSASSSVAFVSRALGETKHVCDLVRDGFVDPVRLDLDPTLVLILTLLLIIAVVIGLLPLLLLLLPPPLFAGFVIFQLLFKAF